MYQPMSYRLGGRMGSRADLRQAIHTCRSLGVRTYADAVINHMVGGGNDANPDHRDTGCTYWGAKDSSLDGMRKQVADQADPPPPHTVPHQLLPCFSRERL